MLAPALAFLDLEVLDSDQDPASITQAGQGMACSRSRDSVFGQKAIRRYPIKKVTTPVPVEGGVAGGALPKSAGTSFHGRRKPKGSACQRRTMAAVQDEAKHAISAMSPLKSCDGRRRA